MRFGLCVLAAMFLWIVIGAWAPPFSFRRGYVPDRDILPRVEFQEPDSVATQTQKDKAASLVRYVYEQDTGTFVQLRAGLKNRLLEISNAPTLDDLHSDVWTLFSPPPMPNVAPANV